MRREERSRVESGESCSNLLLQIVPRRGEVIAMTVLMIIGVGGLGTTPLYCFVLVI